jgi:hypothetical protein
MIWFWSVRCNSSPPDNAVPKNPIERGEKEPREFYNRVLRGFCATHFSEPVCWAEKIFLYERDSIGPQPGRNRCENLGAVTTNHLLLQRHRRKPAFSLPISQPISDFLGGKYMERATRGGGGVQLGAPTESARSEGSHRILFQIGLPYPAPSALKKRRASEPQRNPELSANALSRDFTDHYR